MCVARLHAREDCRKCLPHNTCVWYIHSRFFWKSLRYTYILIHHFTNFSDDRVSAANLVSDLETYKQPPTQFTRKAQPQVCNHHVIILIYTVYTIPSPPFTPTHRHTDTHTQIIVTLHTCLHMYKHTHAHAQTHTHTQEGVPYSL